MKKGVNHLGACHIIFSVALVVLPITAYAQGVDKQRQTKLIEAAKKEGKLVFWNQGQAKEIQPVTDKFQKIFPFLQIEYWRADESTLREKLLSEARAQVYNVDVSGAEIDFILELKKPVS